ASRCCRAVSQEATMFSLQTIFGKGTQFYGLLEQAAAGGHEAAKALCALVEDKSAEPSLERFKLARLRQREISEQISASLVTTFVTPLEREDIDALGSALYKIPKQIERFADRYVLAVERLREIDFAPRAQMLEQA